MDLEDRYARHRLIEGWDQDRLGRARVLVAGAGAVGNEVVKLLALLGFGSILIVDFDTIERSNLTRSPLFREADIGRPKAVVAAERAAEINPGIAVRALRGDLQFDLGLGLIRSADLVIGCLDSLDARLALNRACLRTRTPWLNGAIEVTVAEISLFQADRGACFECGMSAAMWERRAERFSCSGLRSDAPDPKMPTTAIAATLAAGYLVQEALSLIHAGGGTAKPGLAFSEKVTVNLQPYETAVYSLPSNPACLAHDAFGPIEERAEPPSAASAWDLLHWAGWPDGAVDLGFDLVTAMQCAECGGTEPVRQPLERCGESRTRCPRCGGESRYPETVSWLAAGHPLAREPLAALSVPEHQILCVKYAGERRCFQLGGGPIWPRS
jgi:adenylyltransferase/sulfurtransferase